MAFHRFILLLLIAISITAVLSASKQASKNVIVGARFKHDHLLQREFEKEPSKLLQTVKIKKTYPGNKRSRITQVKLLDQNKKGNGATASIVNGGPGSTFVTVEFKSVKGHSVDYIVEIYGR